MSILFRRSAERVEERLLSSLPWDQGGPVGTSTMPTALRLIPVYAAVGLISDTLSTLPMKGFAHTPGGGRAALPVQPQLCTAPGVARVNKVTWKQQAAVSMLLRGNAYGLIAGYDQQGTVSKIRWIDPDQVSVDETSGPEPIYYVGGRNVTDLMVHIPAFTLPGSVVGLSPISLFRVQLETGLRAAEFGRSWFAHGGQPSAILRNSEQIVDPDVADIAKKRFKTAVSHGDLFVTGKDWEYTALSVSPGDAQFLETIKATATQVAAIFKVAPEDIGGETGGSLNYTTVEMNGLRYAQRTITPWTVRLEAALDELLPADQYVKFNLDALSRADLAARTTAHVAALAVGLETLDEARGTEDRAPLTDDQINQWQNLYKRSGSSVPMAGRPTP